MISSDFSKNDSDLTNDISEVVPPFNEIIDHLHTAFVEHDEKSIHHCLTLIDNSRVYEVEFQLICIAIQNLLLLVPNNPIQQFQVDIRKEAIRLITRLISLDVIIINESISNGLLDRIYEAMHELDTGILKYCILCFNKIVTFSESCKNDFLSFIYQQCDFVPFNINIYNNNPSLSRDILKFLINIISDNNNQLYIILQFLCDVLGNTDDDEIVVICLVGLYNFTRFCSKDNWCHFFLTSPIYENVIQWINSPYYKIAEASLLLINSVYCSGETIPQVQSNPSLLLQSLKYENENQEYQTKVRIYASAAISAVIDNNKQNIVEIVNEGILQISSDIFEESNFELKCEMTNFLIIIAIDGLQEHKMQMIEMKFIQFLFEVLDYGDDRLIGLVIRAITELFRAANYSGDKEICYNIVEEIPDHEKFFALPSSENEEIAQLAQQFFEEFYS